jgi:hypothetical protein
MAIDLDEVTKYHVEGKNRCANKCACCLHNWPCPTIQLADEVRDLRAEVERLRLQVLKECLCDESKPYGKTLCNIHAVTACVEMRQEIDRLRAALEDERARAELMKKCNAANIQEGLKTAKENRRLNDTLSEIRLNCTDCKGVIQNSEEIARAALPDAGGEVEGE